jgi:RNA polymerase sigma factor (sigma-70 family)
MPDATLAAIDARDLYERFGRAVYRRCQYFLKSDADALDAMHDVFVKVVERRAEFRAEASPLTWMVRIATNHCLNLIRARRARWHDRYAETVAVAETTREAPTPALERQQLVAAVIGRADRDALEAAVYYFVDEMSQEDAARAASCSVPTLRKRLRKFIKAARQELKRIDVDVVFGEPPV